MHWFMRFWRRGRIRKVIFSPLESPARTREAEAGVDRHQDFAIRLARATWRVERTPDSSGNPGRDRDGPKRPIARSRAACRPDNPTENRSLRGRSLGSSIRAAHRTCADFAHSSLILGCNPGRPGYTIRLGILVLGRSAFCEILSPPGGKFLA